jgi:pantoate--beta-alanine ligase
MQLITSPSEMGTLARNLRSQGKVVTLVPTMGALHRGHLSLVERARDEGDILIVSIFVNPTQFGPGEDYERYPRNLDRDLELLTPFNPEAVFAPAATDMYPAGFSTTIEPGPVAASLEGAARPGHFRGVATIVLKLFNLIRPHIACFGQKDFQQVAVLRRMVQDLNVNTRIRVCPTVREPDGLAISSRNAYLSSEDREAAPVLYRSLRRAQELFQTGEIRASALLEIMQSAVASEPAVKLGYVAVVNPASMEVVEETIPGSVLLIAAQVGPARLIDNLILGPATASETELIELAFEGPTGPW